MSNVKDTDFPFFHNLFHGSCLEQQEAIGVNSGLTFALAPFSPKGLFHNFPNVMESLEPYTKDQYLNANFNSFSHELPLAPTIQNGTFLHGFPMTNEPFWGSQILNFQDQEMPQNYTNPSFDLSFIDLGYSTNGIPDQNGQEKKVAGQDKKNKIHTMREESRAQKKAPIAKGPWTSQEDNLLVQLVETHGIRRWTKIAKMLSGRVGKQCRERWHNHLRPDIKKNTWTEEDDKMLIRAHKTVGNKWVEIARRLPGRSENAIKNHWNATMRKLDTKKKNKNPNSKGSLLLDYIRSVVGISANKNNHHILNNVVIDNGESSSQAADNAASFEHDHADPQMQLLPKKSDVNFFYNWAVNPVDNVVYSDDDHDKNIIDLRVPNDDESLYSNSYGFRSFLDEMTAMEEGSNVDFQMRSEIDSLMEGPAKVKKEMDLVEMICQGKI